MNYRIPVNTDYRTDPKLCGTVLRTLNRFLKYFCGMYNEVIPSKSSKFGGIIFLCH